MRASEQGNILFYILIAIVLLAALSYAVSQSTRGSTGQLNEEKARLLATEIIDYGNTMASAVAQLRLRGVKESALCFYDPGWGDTAYDHAGCGDNINKIFNIAGAGMIWSRPPAQAMDQTAAPDNLWHIYGDNEVQGVGTTCGAASCADLVLVVDELNQPTCAAIDKMLGIANTGDPLPADSGVSETRYNGVFDTNAVIGDEGGGTALQGKTAGCFEKTANPTGYTFYKVLLAR